SGALAWAAAFAFGRIGEMIQRGGGGREFAYTHAGVARRGLDPAVSEEHLNHADVFTVFQQMGGKAVAEGMCGDAFIDAGKMSCFAADLLDGSRRDVLVWFDGRKQPRLGRALATKVLPQHEQQSR